MGYVRMVFETGLGAMEEDVRVVIEWLKGGGVQGGSGGAFERWWVGAVGGWRSGWLRRREQR